MALISAKKALHQAKLDTGWVSVSSSWVAAIRHMGSHDGRLFVRFHNGGSGFYSGVPRDVYYRMFRAASKGKFLHRVVIPTYTWTSA